MSKKRSLILIQRFERLQMCPKTLLYNDLKWELVIKWPDQLTDWIITVQPCIRRLALVYELIGSCLPAHSIIKKRNGALADVWRMPADLTFLSAATHMRLSSRRGKGCCRCQDVRVRGEPSDHSTAGEPDSIYNPIHTFESEARTRTENKDNPWQCSERLMYLLLTLSNSYSHMLNVIFLALSSYTPETETVTLYSLEKWRIWNIRANR